MATEKTIQDWADQEYKYGFTTPLAMDTVPAGLSEDVIRLISHKKGEPEWMLEWRLKAYRHWLKMKEPTWSNVHHPPIDFNAITYYAAAKQKVAPKSMDEVDPELRNMYNKLGISVEEQARLVGVAMDIVVDSASVQTTFKKQLGEMGIIFCSMSEAIRDHPDLVKKYIGTVVPHSDNFYAALNSAVFTDGSFAYIPKGVRCPVELSTYFRINTAGTGQFERTLIVAEEGSYVSYLEGCLPPWEEISCGDTLRPIAELELGQEVLNENGAATSVDKLMYRTYRGDLVNITPLSSGNAFQVTTEHPVLVIRGDQVRRPPRARGGVGDVVPAQVESAKPLYVPAKDVKVGDYLVFPINQVARDDATLTPDLLRLLGYYVSEGCVTKFNGHAAVEFSFGAHEEPLIEETCLLVERLTGKRPSRSNDVKKNGVYLVTYDKTLVRLMEEHGAKYAEHKRFSKAFMDLPPDKQQLTIDTYYAGDGSVSKAGRNIVLRAATTSRQLAFQLQELLARQGIYASINPQAAYEETMKDGRVIQHKKKYLVYYAMNRRSERAKRRDNAFLVPVRNVRREFYEGIVQNFETKTDPHSYLVKGFAVHNCTAPMRDENQLHAAVVELVAHDDAEIKYSTIQNWYPGDKEGKGGIYNFVTKRGKCAGRNSKISWTQIETGSAITWKYPSCILQGDNSIGEFYSVAMVKNRQQADTGTKMIHIGKNTRSTIISKGISAGEGQNTYRGQVKFLPSATGARNYSVCDSLLIGDKCGAHTFPDIEVKNPTAQMEHEATTSKIGEDQLFYLRQRGLSEQDAISLIVNGFAKQVMKELPMEFAIEAQKLLGVQMEGAVG